MGQKETHSGVVDFLLLVLLSESENGVRGSVKDGRIGHETSLRKRKEVGSAQCLLRSSRTFVRTSLTATQVDPISPGAETTLKFSCPQTWIALTVSAT